jgi:hypothetical protein
MKTFANNTAKYASVMAMTAFLTFFTLATSEAKTVKSDDQVKLSNEITMLNNDVKIPNGDRIATDQLAKSFKVSSEKITALRNKNLDYGEIAAVLGIADKMSGGTNDANINRVANLRRGAGGWPQVAANAGVDVGDVAKKVGSVEDDVHKEIKRTAAGEYTGGGAGGTSGTSSTSSERDVGTAGADY